MLRKPKYLMPGVPDRINRELSDMASTWLAHNLPLLNGDPMQVSGWQVHTEPVRNAFASDWRCEGGVPWSANLPQGVAWRRCSAMYHCRAWQLARGGIALPRLAWWCRHDLRLGRCRFVTRPRTQCWARVQSRMAWRCGEEGDLRTAAAWHVSSPNDVLGLSDHIPNFAAAAGAQGTGKATRHVKQVVVDLALGLCELHLQFVPQASNVGEREANIFTARGARRKEIPAQSQRVLLEVEVAVKLALRCPVPERCTRCEGGVLVRRHLGRTGT
mmetsp:Transcript_10583/g.37149  ORF Transcript_10583/g.37149 Transcript_10583/m.37149 type:complete len:272 (+) Transcript_10583:257-1072(+)